MAANDDTEELLQALVQRTAGAAELLTPRVYEELRRLAVGIDRDEWRAKTLQPTALVHEAYVKLVNCPAGVDFRGETHFKAVAARAMRQVLIDAIRSQGRLKRGGGQERITLSGLPEAGDDQQVDFYDLERALERLSRLDPRAAQVVELRFFGGLTEQAVAEVLGVTDRTVRTDWSMARAWLRVELGSSEDELRDSPS